MKRRFLHLITVFHTDLSCDSDIGGYFTMIAFEAMFRHSVFWKRQTYVLCTL